MKEIHYKRKLNLVITLFSSFAVLFLSACGQPIMPPVTYDKPIDFQVKKNAVLRWEFGKQYDGTVPNYSQPNGGLIGAAVAASIRSDNEANNASGYTLSYGKAEQAIFMTSFRDVLRQNQVFKEVELVGETAAVSNKDVLIDVFFKTARVSSVEKNYRITLTVTMTINSQGKLPFNRTYLVQSNAQGYGISFIEQQEDVSKRLLEKLILGIEEWHRSKS
jgi:hypothetical protein